MDRKYAEYLLEKTRKDYNLIADEFSRTREYIPEERKKLLLQYITPGEKVLDLGCGNGRFYEVLGNIDYYGVDISEKMIETAKNRYPKAKFQVTDALNLPFPNNFFDKIFSFAVFHHIPSQEFRLQFLKEARRVLKKEGLLILTVWNLNPCQMILIGGYRRAEDFLKYQIFKILRKLNLDFGDFFISWQNIIPRYIHCFTFNGLKKLTQKAGFKIKDGGILKSLKSKESNIYLVAQKPS